MTMYILQSGADRFLEGFDSSFIFIVNDNIIELEVFILRMKRERLDLEEIKKRISEINDVMDRTIERGKKIEAFIERWKDVLRRTDDPFEKLKAKGYIEYYETELKILKRRLELLKKLLRFHEFLRIFNERMESIKGKRMLKVSKRELEKLLDGIERRFIEDEIHMENLEDMVDNFIREMEE